MMAFGLDASRKIIGLFFNHLGKSWRCSGAERGRQANRSKFEVIAQALSKWIAPAYLDPRQLEAF